MMKEGEAIHLLFLILKKEKNKYVVFEYWR